jgi:transcriptional regulator with XRE-family HTH domain
MKTVGARLRRLRLKAGLTCDQLAVLSDLPAVSVYAYEANRRCPTLGSLFRLAAALGASLADFDGCRPPPDARRRKRHKAPA